MLSFLDIKTLLFVTSIISLVLCVCMLYVYQTRKTYHGFKHWTIASILYCLAFFLMSLRNVVPDFISIIVGNTLIIAGNGYVAYGIEIFTKNRRRLWFFVSLTLLTILLFSIYTYIIPNINFRIIAISFIIAIIYFYSAYLIHANVNNLTGSNNLFLVITFASQALWNVLRIVQTITMERSLECFFDASLFHAMTVAVFFCGNIFIIIGLIILNSQRVEYDLTIADEEVKTLRGIIPICSHCKEIRNNKGAWIQLEQYIEENSGAEFSHSICEDCLQKYYPDNY